MIKNITVALDFDNLDFEDIIKYVEEEGSKVILKEDLDAVPLK